MGSGFNRTHLSTHVVQYYKIYKRNEYILGENIEWTNGRPRNEAEYDIGEFDVKKVRIPPGYYESPNDNIKVLNH